jgi:tRNA CCA-adding enzyme
MLFPFERLKGMRAATKVLAPATLRQIATIKARVLERIKPTESEIDRVSSVTNRVSDAVRDILRNQPIAIDYIEPQGSTGLKQTQLAGSSDVDLFIGVNPAAIDAYKDSPKKEIKEKLKEIFTSTIKDALVPGLTGALNPQNIMFSYAEHPYLTIVVDKVKFDIVFCLNLTSSYIEREDIVTAMDRTPLHSKFVKDNLTSEQKDEVRLLKAFFKAHHVYGDKAAPGPMGFIGYGVEILVHFFGNLENIMVNFNDLPSHPVDVFDRDPTELRNVQRFANDFLIIIDPTDRNRNVGSSTDERCFLHARHEIQAFLDHPSPEHFDMAPIPELPNDDQHFFAVVFNNEQQVHYTIVRDKLYRLSNLARKELECEQTGEARHGRMAFSVLLAKDETQAAIAFQVEHPFIPATFRLLGPAQHDDKARVRAYLEKHPDARVDERGTYYTEKTRNVTSFPDALAKFVKSRLDIKGAAPVKNTRRGIDVSANPEPAIGRQAIYVLKHMVLPYLSSE